MEYKIVVDFNTKAKESGKEIDTGESTKENKQVDDGFDTKSLVKKIGASALVAGAFKWQVSLVGRNQGNALVQEKINGAMSLAGMVGGIALGFKAGGVLGGALAIAGVGLSLAKDIEQYNYDARWQNVGLSLARERAGTSSAVNRSRNV